MPTPQQDNLSSFSLMMKSVGVNKATGERYWKADTSDIFPDNYNDEMSLDLYRSFMERITEGIQPPEQYRSEAWEGGMPYVSVSHYREHSIAGDADKVYVDGAILKACGTFRDTPLGRACFDALWDDLYTKKNETSDRIRVSIAFLDYKHQHKLSGFIFERKSLSDVCPECEREKQSGGRPGRIFLDGHLIHLAMTRVPVNDRTLMEVRSMTTRKEDAESIVGEELAEEIEKKERSLVGRSDAVVIKSEEEKSDMEEERWMPFGGATTLADARSFIETSKEQQRVGDIWYTFQAVLGNIMSSEMEMSEKSDRIKKCSDEFKSMVNDKNAQIFESLAAMDIKGDVVEPEEPAEVAPEVEDPILSKIDSLEKVVAALLAKLDTQVVKAEAAPEHPLDSAIGQLRSDFDSVILMEGTSEDRLRAIQTSFNNLGGVIRESMTVQEVKTEATPAQPNDALLNVIQKLSDKLDMIASQQKSTATAPEQMVTPPRRSFVPSSVPQTQTPARQPVRGETPLLRALIDKSVGL